ncbi:MAG TPA: methylmalonyl Co-A mutase-associated GTPase MeaB [Flavitalea sp.]|nr:methylmalonyl Co-A mutase-associated GTPase MeaB [Flavitalea sp.]
MWHSLLDNIKNGDTRALSRAISLVENEAPGYEQFLRELPHNPDTRIIGITGPPGSGKSTITDLLIGELVRSGGRIAVICIDPSSPFTHGALLGDRIRMREWYTHPHVFIRSLSSRGALGGLNPSVIEIADVIKAAPFDKIIIETVGVGQNEIEIASLADTTLVVQVPESGDDIQTMKSGLMEIADIFVVNKCDRPGADLFVRTLQAVASGIGPDKQRPPVIKMTATQQQGVAELLRAIAEHEEKASDPQHIPALLAERAYHLLIKQFSRRINKQELIGIIGEAYTQAGFNLYKTIDRYANGK